MFELFNETLVLMLILMVILTGLGVRYWRNPLASSVHMKLKESEAQVAKLQKTSEHLTRTIQQLEVTFQKQFETVEGKVTRLGTDVGAVRKEAHDVDTHVGSLAAKTDVALTKVDAIKTQVEAEVSELKRIDDQVKDSLGKVKSNALQIRYLEDEVHGLERELAMPQVRVRREHHAD